MVKMVLRFGHSKSDMKGLNRAACWSWLNKRGHVRQEVDSTLHEAVRGVTPDVVTETKRVGGSTYRVPIEVVPAKGKALAIRWSLIACRKRSGRSMALRSSDELIDAARNSGSAIRKKEETHKVAEANKAFAHFR
ncbi:hypothetical protein GOP47_0019611 [Adiantum capillus-veneris]|uniref:Small ribosomal subunit protein uS7 domain-containing protein n=1 Tax=Adiantum capillus-veneris TaxID=13818 RepID=A0A9D4Z9S4_ADICA|nr:hypothetical protein GOP47_0019611 [Adiantum capillus-veneris]